MTLEVLLGRMILREWCLCWSTSVEQKIGSLRKSLKMFFGDQLVLQKCFNSFILPCLEYFSPVWCSAGDSHLRLLDRNLSAIKFLIPGLSVDLWHRCAISSLCMSFKICCNPKHPLYSDLPGLFHPAQIEQPCSFCCEI